MLTADIKSELEKVNHFITIPQAFLDELDAVDEINSINTCGYSFAKSYKLIPNEFEGINFLPACLIHDWRRSKIQPTELKAKYESDIEFINNLLTIVNQHPLSPTDRKALNEICFLYGQCVLTDQVVEGKSVWAKLMNVLKVMTLVLWYPIKATIRHITLLMVRR